MNCSRTVTIATFLLLLASSCPAFSDDPAREPGAMSRPGSSAPKGPATRALHTSPREPAHLDSED
jgi:hypothetical protein